MLDAVYVDARDQKRIVAIKPKPPFRPVFQVATAKVRAKHAPEARRCFWWRRGSVGLGLKHGLTLFILFTVHDERLATVAWHPLGRHTGGSASVS
jgi:hypothetical protein